jgi:hypothetical protein
VTLFGGATRTEPAKHAKRHAAHRQRDAERDKAASLAGRDIGELPPVADAARREACRLNFRLFCETYYSDQFYLAWSDDHREVIAALEAAVLRGELLAFAMSRGSGKSALIEAAGAWALVYGHREFVVIIGATEEHAAQMLENIKVAFETRDLLAADFPEVCYPIAKLERINNRARGQLYRGKPTHIHWKGEDVQLPTIPGSPASGGIIRVRGITGSIRGMAVTRACDGRKVRPSLVLVDDPQTDKSARSPSQVAQLEKVFKGAVLGLAGPDVQIAGLVTVTVVAPDDLAERLLDRERNPACHGRRMKMVYDWPTEIELWEKYAELRRAGQRSGAGTGDADKLFADNLERMTAGCRVGWPSRMKPAEIHAIQSAYNLRIDKGEAVFAAEYQNEPLPVVDRTTEELTAPEIADKLNRYPRQFVPLGCQHLSMFIDCQQHVLYWAICAWEENFTGFLIDYGAYPEQRRPYFTVRDITKTLTDVSRAKSIEGAIMEGLESLTARYLGREWKREDGATMRIERCLVDANYRSDTIYQFCRESSRAGVVMPSHGQGVKASSLPFAMYAKKPGDRVGHYWRVPNVAKKRIIRHVMIDTNYWKSFVHSRLAVPRGDPGCLSLFGEHAETHRMIADHLVAEYRVTNTAKGRTVEEWQARPGKPDNHWLDCLVGCAVGASMQGATLEGASGFRPARKKRVSFAAMQRQRRGAG